MKRTLTVLCLSGLLLAMGSLAGTAEAQQQFKWKL
jgi:hypothetical protein